jgi:hypothetical protein
MSRFILLLFLAIGVVSCKSARLGPYTSPAVKGRVVASDTREPLAGVEVTRDGGRRGRDLAEPPKGAELLLQNYTGVTDRDGQFLLASQRALTLFRPSGWDSVRLEFRRAGYERFRTNYSIVSAGTNSPAGEPIIETGDIALRRAGR